MTKKNAPKLTICPSPARDDYKADLATRRAQERAARDQTPLMSLASKVQADYHARLDRSEVKR